MKVSINGLYNLPKEDYKSTFAKLTGCRNQNYVDLLIEQDNIFDTFTLQEKFDSPPYLSDSLNKDEIIRKDINDFLSIATKKNYIVCDDLHDIIDFILKEASSFFSAQIENRKISEMIYFIEYPDIINNIIEYCLLGTYEKSLHIYKEFNNLGKELCTDILKKLSKESLSLKEYLTISISSGLIGIDLKGTSSAASSFAGIGVPLMVANETIKQKQLRIYDFLKSKSNYVIDDWNYFEEVIYSDRPVNILWFTDDYIESMFDLLFISKVVEEKRNINITIVPKNGQHGNDASFKDISDLLELEVYSDLSAKVKLCGDGSTLGLVNVLKLSSECQKLIENSDFIIIKGCRTHEISQGCIDKPTFVAFSIVREFTVSETGYSATDCPLFFMKLPPYAKSYWGFKGRHEGKIVMEPNIKTVLSTTKQQNEFKIMNNLNNIVERINELETLFTKYPEYSQDIIKESKLLIDKLNEQTRISYEQIGDKYTEIRNDEPSAENKQEMLELVDFVRESKNCGNNDVIKIADMGAGGGRDSVFLTSLENTIVYSIDNSSYFINCLDNLVKEGLLLPNTIFKGDIRKTDFFENSIFDCVRYNASILHLPLLSSKLGADEVLIDAYRLLKKNGVIYIRVKKGEGFVVHDTKENLGKRCFQYYDVEKLESLLLRNNFKILKLSERSSTKRKEPVTWISAFAIKN